MKKLLLSILATAFCITAAMAQPVLTQSSIGATGSIFFLGVDTVPSPALIGSAGASQSWVMTSLGVDDLDTALFLVPTGLPNAGDFPTSNFAVVQSSQGGVAYFESTSSYLDLLGAAGDVDGSGNYLSLHQNPPLRTIQFPFTYLDQYASSSTADITFDASSLGIPFVDSVRFKNVQDQLTVADGWGTLSLPSANFTNVLRTKRIVSQVDTIWAHTFLGWQLAQDTAYTDSTFTWWDDTKGYYLAEAQYEGPTLAQITYEDPIIVAVDPSRNSLVSTYPNPARDRMTIRSEVGARTIQVLDIHGRIVKAQAVIEPATEMDLTGLKPGYYFYRLEDSDGQMLHSGNFVVDK